MSSADERRLNFENLIDRHFGLSTEHSSILINLAL